VPPVPAVALAPGTGGVKELYHEPFARRFAEAGIAALLFDYRCFGTSGGEPRQRLLPRDQIEDYRSALTWLSLQPEIDARRMGVWGASLSGGHVLHVAAYDPRVKAVVSTEGPVDVHQMLRAAVGEEQFAVFAPSWRNELTMSSLEAILEYAPGRSIELIAPRPLLVMLGTEDTNTSPGLTRAAFARAGEPKRLLELDGDHYSIYPGARDTTSTRSA
jgi:uncharacterized protein